MTEKLKQIIKEEVLKLPKEVQEAINSLDWRGIAEEIGKKYKLNESEINDFQVETLLILVGLEEAEFYVRNIENNVGTSKDEAEKISREAFERIFIPIDKAITENIKKGGMDKNAKPHQTIDFILSGGDYGSFLEENPPLLDKEGARGGNGTGNHLAFSTPPQKGGEGSNSSIPIKPKITDIKRKFTI